MKIKRLSTFELTFDDGTTAVVDKLGAGRFCTAYRSRVTPANVYLVVNTDRGGHSKELLGHLEGEPHIPMLEEIGEIGDRTVYLTRFYHAPLKAARREAWQQFKTLARLRECAYHEALDDYDHNTSNRWPEIARRTNELTVDAARGQLPDALVETLDSLKDWASSYGAYIFEFAPRNLATDDDGTLILLDPVFDIGTLHKDRIARQQRAMQRTRY